MVQRRPRNRQDFEYAWKRVLNPDTASQYAYIISTFVKGAAEYNTGDGSADDVAVRRTDDKTLEVELVPLAVLARLTSFFTYLPQNQKFVEEQGEDYALSAEALIFNGPYTSHQLQADPGRHYGQERGLLEQGQRRHTEGGGQDRQGAGHRREPLRVWRARRHEIDGEYVDEYKGSPDYHTLYVLRHASTWSSTKRTSSRTSTSARPSR